LRLVIAEKPSVAQSIAAVIGARKRCDGYLEGGGYLVSWCVGHLIELAAADAYDEKYSKWRYDDLPILPQKWMYSISPDTKKQFSILKKLMADSRVDGLVCATDAGREGELIFRLVYEQAGCSKPVERLWISSMEESAIADGFRKLKSSKEYDNLYQSALCRAKADWLVGINMTRLFSVLYHQTLNVGRVMTPTLAMIVTREAAISAFKQEPFYNVVLDCGGFAVSGEKLKDKGEAERIAADCNGKAATVKSVERKDKTDKPPKLYDLTSLQRDANRLYGYTAQQTLDYAQSLYEKKLCTYPRTDSRYLTSDMADSTPVIINAAAMALPFARQFPVTCDMAQVIDNSKVSDHHAIIPTLSVKGFDLAALPAGERDILTLVIVRLVCAVGKPHRYAETTVSVECEGESFTAKGKSVIDKGWKAADTVFHANLRNKPDEEKEAALPSLSADQTFKPVMASVKEGKTSPPKHFTEDTLLSAMETAGAEDMPEDAERKGLGTPATRAGILEKLVKTAFVERKGDKKTKYLLPTHKGVSLITVLPEAIQSPQLTAEWEQRLKLIERGELVADDFLADICELIVGQIKTYEAIKGGDVLFPSGRESVGKCPRCGSSVVENKKGFTCENRDCRFALWKDNKFFSSKGKVLTKQNVAALLKNGRVKLSGLHSEKTGKTYDATVVMEDTGEKYVSYRLEFEAK
jgi:DNA topoisomerase-3